MKEDQKKGTHQFAPCQLLNLRKEIRVSGRGGKAGVCVHFVSENRVKCVGLGAKADGARRRWLSRHGERTTRWVAPHETRQPHHNTKKADGETRQEAPRQRVPLQRARRPQRKHKLAT
jgi:hypothetical protein